ncbi:hypothetical protein FGG08_000182 [Glutinoglossum americanum]|uniref:Ribosome biogenesis protein NOP53 n=1 Tax=Glutinoglossum americanum TaxID=1670608 RepID=A0A9P8I9T1_9PEZI|nr:hypothetical protein FGG08_000182 [Glutinoglossum americanum]
MASATQPPRQYKQPSRKGKKAWRKNVDITEIQEGLEILRDEITTGGVIAEKVSEELFAIDTTGDKEIGKEYRLKHKPLKADEILAARSAVPPVDSRKRLSRLTDGVLEPSSKRRRAGGVPFRELQRLKQIAYGGESIPKDVIKVPETKTFDPWVDTGDGAIATQDPRFSFLSPPKPVKEPKTLKQAPISLAADGKEIPAVKKPDPGISYNPAFKDWDKLLVNEGKKEVEAEKKRLQEAEEERKMLERVAAAVEEGDAVISDQEDGVEDVETGATEGAWLARKRPERNTQAQKNKIKQRKEAERKALWEAQMKKKAIQATEIKKIEKAIKAKEQARAEAAARKREVTGEGDDRVLRRRRFGKTPIVEPPLELVLPDELQDSLRLLKPEGNLLGERFRNVLVRGKLETRRPITQWKKKRRSITEKWTYKDFKI